MTIQDFRERRAFRGREIVDDARCRMERHTVDIRHRDPQHIQDELLAVERGYRYAKWAWLFLGVLVVAYVVVRVWGGGR